MIKRDKEGGRSRFNPFAEALRSSLAAKNPTKAKMAVGKGRSHISGNIYKHD